MAIVDAIFYKEVYHGDAVTDDSFDRYLVKAKAFLDRLTFGRIAKTDIEDEEVWGVLMRQRKYTSDFLPFDEDELASIRMGVCSMMDAMVNVDNVSKQAMAGNSDQANIRSRSSGGESVTYDSNRTVYADASADKKVEAMLYRSALMEYVNPSAFHVNPFYAGTRW